ncbi:MAG TPA: helix-turn-helix domain-containing protein [Chitinophagaceae bacterium]|nr:helix-turn-helix domain-containing protein [Chitinophagaceae bacterium]
MDNLQDFIANNPLTPKIKVDELLFAEFKCPLEEESGSVWWHNNFFTHVLTGETVLKTPKQEYKLRAGDSVFAKKGSVITHNHIQEDFCELLIFVPDDFIRTVVKKYNVSLAEATYNERGDTIIPLSPDNMLLTYFQSLLNHFHQSLPAMAEMLLKLKFEELLLTILSGNNHAHIKNYFSEICRSSKPSITEIMEANFFSNLSLEEFARLCARSLSGFKQEFKNIYQTTPGKWLQEKRLEYGRYLLETTHCSIDEICMESGFENLSHFIRIFKNRYGFTPGKFKMQKISPAQ